MMSHICLNNYKHYLLQLFQFLDQPKIFQGILKLMHLNIVFTLIKSMNPSYKLGLFYKLCHLKVFFSDNLLKYKKIIDNNRNYMLFNLMYFSSFQKCIVFPFLSIQSDNLCLISIIFLHHYLTILVNSLHPNRFLHLCQFLISLPYSIFQE